MTERRLRAAHSDDAPRADAEALSFLVAIVDELGEIALMIAATIEAGSTTQTVIVAANELRRAATSLRREADHLLDRFHAA